MLIGARGSSTFGGIVVPDSTRLYTGLCTVAGRCGAGTVVAGGTVVGGASRAGESGRLPRGTGGVLRGDDLCLYPVIT